MHSAKLLLELLTKHIPPGKGQRHNITLNKEGLEITLMLGDIYAPILLKEVDFDSPVRSLASAIRDMVKQRFPRIKVGPEDVLKGISWGLDASVDDLLELTDKVCKAFKELPEEEDKPK